MLDLKAIGYESLAASIVACFNWHPEPQRLASGEYDALVRLCGVVGPAAL